MELNFQSIIGLIISVLVTGGVFGKIIYDRYEVWKAERNKLLDYDRVLFLKIRDILITHMKRVPYSLYLETYDWDNSGAWGFCFDLLDFVQSGVFRDVEIIFLSNKLEKKKLLLFNSVRDIIQVAPFDREVGDFWFSINFKANSQDEYNKQVWILKCQLVNLWKNYEKFLEYGRKRFKV